jgi:hypothetical protein
MAADQARCDWAERHTDGRRGRMLVAVDWAGREVAVAGIARDLKNGTGAVLDVHTRSRKAYAQWRNACYPDTEYTLHFPP